MTPTCSRLSRILTVCSVTALSAVEPARTLHAQAVTVTFNTLTESTPGSGTRFVPNCFVESGFWFTVVGVPCTGAMALDAFVAGSNNSQIFVASTTPSLLLNSPEGSLIDITREEGGTFSFLSIALAPFLEASTGVMFTGTRVAGNVTQSFDLPGTQNGFQTLFLNAGFTNLTSLRLTATNEFAEPLVVFDDVALVGAQAVLEPATLVLLVTGLVGIALLRLRRSTRGNTLWSGMPEHV